METRAKPSAFASPSVAALLIVAVAIATRIVAWWNPVAHVDDQFYLLAGEELLKGNWPYVDVWDRKPLGLFLLYAGIAWIGGGSILGLNVIATGFAGATAWVIRQIGLRFASPGGATLGALAYLFVIPLVGGQTGQSPVFYNLLMAGAALLLFKAVEAGGAANVIRNALFAMLLCGLAMTIKQISFVEGTFFGLAFLWLLKRRGISLPRIAAIGATMIAIALLPTALTLAGYALAGQADAYIFATITSIFLKSGWSADAKTAGLLFFVLHLTPLLLMAVAGAVMRWRRGASTDDRLLIGWAAAALIGYAAVPHFFDHYALPVVVPLSVAAAAFLDSRSGRLWLVALAAFSVMQPPIRDLPKNWRGLAGFNRLAEAVDQARNGGCIHVGDGPTRLYSATGACRVTPYLFPDHLNLGIESRAVGVDPETELQLILAKRPAVVVDQIRPSGRHSLAYRRFMDAIRREYRLTYTSSIYLPPTIARVSVWQRRDLPPPPKS